MPKIKIKEGFINYKWINENIDSKTILVFLHEALGSVSQWKSFPKILCDSLKIKGLVYDRLGYGHSSEDPKIRNKRYLENFALLEMPQVINKLIPKKKIHIIGHSDGGSIALIFASKYPKKTISITTIAAHVFVENITIQGIKPAVEAYKNGKLDGLRKYHGEKTDHLFYNWARTWSESSYRNWNIEKYLKHIESPALIIQGKNDQYGTENQVDAICSQIQKRSIKLMLKDCGHAPHLEKTNSTVLKIMTFIDEIRYIGEVK